MSRQRNWRQYNTKDVSWRHRITRSVYTTNLRGRCREGVGVRAGVEGGTSRMRQSSEGLIRHVVMAVLYVRRRRSPAIWISHGQLMVKMMSGHYRSS